MTTGAIEIPILISGANDALTLLGRLSDGLINTAVRMAELADEQGRLDTASRDLGLNFDAAAASAGRFVDETEAMGVANRFAAADIRLTQQQLNDVMRVAGASADMLGTNTAGAVDTLREALIRGREGGLERFGQGLASVAGESHTVEDRLAALHVRAGEMAQATDTATDRLNRFKDSLEDSERTFATAFVGELTRLAEVGQGLADANGDAEEFARTIAAVGATAASMVTKVVLGVSIIGGAIGTVVGSLTGVVQLAEAATHGLAAFNAERDRLHREGLAVMSVNVVQDAINRLEAIDAESEQRTTAAVEVIQRARPTRAAAPAPAAQGRAARAATAAPVDMTFTAEQAAADRLEDIDRLLGINRAQNAELATRAVVDGLIEEERVRQRVADRAQSLAQRGLADAIAANDAENALTVADVTSAGPSRAALLAAEETATRELARATADLSSARRDENDASLSAEERTTRMTTAFTAQTVALQRQRAAQRAVTAEVDKIKTDRVDALTGAAKGLSDGLVSAGVAALIAGENVGVALQKQLAASLQALAIESAQKALYSLATGFFYLATGNPAAVPAFTSAAIFGSVAVGAGLASAAIAPSAAPAAAGGGADERASRVSPGGAGGMGGGSGAGPIVNNYYAPIVGGRQSTDAETGVRIDRYNDAARARLRRAA